MTAWTLHYERGEPFSSEDGKPNDSPGWGVLCIAQPGADYRDLVWKEKFYIFRSDRGCWSGHDEIGLIDQLVHFAPVIEAVRVGRDTANSEMAEAVAIAGIQARGR